MCKQQAWCGTYCHVLTIDGFQMWPFLWIGFKKVLYSKNFHFIDYEWDYKTYYEALWSF